MGICDTSRKVDGINLSVYIPCIITDDGSYCSQPLIFKNVIFYGAIEENKSFYKIYLKIYFNKKKSVRNKALVIKHLSKERIFDIVSMLNLASDRIDLDCFKLDELDSSILYLNESILAHRLISGIKYKIYERYTNRPGRDDYFDLIKGIISTSENEYFNELVKNSIKSDNSPREDSIKLQSIKIIETEREITSITLSHDSGWTTFPEPKDNIEQGNFKIDLFLVDIVRKFNKYEYLLSELKMKPNELPNNWEIQDSKKLLSLMKEILKGKLGLTDNKSSWYNDTKLKEIEKELRAKIHHFGFLFDADFVYFKKGNPEVSFFYKRPTAISIPQYFENSHWLQSRIFVPICYSDKIETFFLLDDEAHNIFMELKKRGFVR